MSNAWASTITPVALPLSRDAMGANGAYMGGSYEGIHSLSKRKGYALSVPVSGYHNLRDGRVVWREANSGTLTTRPPLLR
jgi:hypothetical protein